MRPRSGVRRRPAVPAVHPFEMATVLRKRAGFEDEGAPGGELDEGNAPDRILVCAACDHVVTKASARIDKAGRHRHTCVNPAGIVFHIACFATASGAVAHGLPTDHFSWFDGYRWQMASCGACSQHLGWHFLGDDAFWGLIADRLAERDLE